ncbi:MAG TPA: hypothetical protein VKB34_16435, partial [Povalibacter sp.]|nr:hypothetical protein [Povalibacter sp.]
VRVYPDKIHIDSHEPDLTADEVTWGQHYWEQDWHAGNDADARAAAWRQIADRLTAERAAWVVRSLTPTNPAQRPTGATPPDQALATEPAFPVVAVATSNDTWRRAPQARLLPDRWLAIVHSEGKVALRATSKDIQRPLNVGPNPQAPPLDDAARAAVERGDRLAIDDDMKWMVDFNLAETAGMALRIAVPAALLTKLDSLLVFGVLRSATAAQTADQLANLLDAHHYTDGLALLRPGTPTNNTDDRRAGYSSADSGHSGSYATEILARPAGGATNAQRIGAALGLPSARIDATLGHVDHALADDDGDMRSMNTALWQVGWGYFLSNMVGAEAGLTRDSIDWARQHFLDNVRCFGPLPALRCGPQPYGILPVTSLGLWQGGANETRDAGLQKTLVTLRDGTWRNAVGSVARIGRRAGPDPDNDLVDVMRTDALSASYHTRNVFGRHFLQHLYLRLFSSMPDSDPAQTALLEQLQISWRSRLTHMWNAGWQWDLTIPLVQTGEVSPWRKLEPNYIDDLLNQPYTALLGAAATDPQSASLLHTLLRHATLREIAQAAALLLAKETNTDPLPLLRDAELVDLVSGAPLTQHWLRQLGTPTKITDNKPIGDYLRGLQTFTQPEVKALGDFRTSLARLKDLDSEALSYLMQGTLDLSANRLDAWITSFATKRLAAMRTGGSAGQYIGAYGWVENLTQIPTTLYHAVTALPNGEAGPLQTLAKDSGFIHAPSMTHAATAALLRNAHLGASDVPSATSPFAINLSSRRVREASRLLDGVRQGQPLGALLGYRVERILHEMGADHLIATLREIAPLAARSRENSPVPVATIAANNVVDGLVLNRRTKEESDTVLKLVTPQFHGTGDFNAWSTAIRALDDMIDGLSDALTAEAAYQMARGNTSRLAGTLSSIAQGESAPPELEVTRVPRTGTAVTHRLALLMSGTTNLTTPGWLGGDTGMRSSSERLLNFWVGRLLGDASKIRCTIERLDDTSGAVVETRKIPLGELAITPLDVIYSVEAASDAAPAPSALSELEQQVLYYSKHKTGGFDPRATLRLQHARPTDLAAGETTLFDILEQARATRRLLSVARGADPEDFNPPERQTKGVVDLDELSTRAAHALNTLNTAHKALNTLVTKLSTATAESLRTAIVKLGVFGVGPAVPVSVTGEDPASIAALAKQAQALLKVSGPRLDRATALSKAPAATDPRARRDQLVERIKTVFGSSFVVLPRFKLDSAGATELTGALAASAQTQGGDALAANTWFTRSARVRDAVGRLGLCLQMSEIINAGARLNLSVAQLPFVSGERWVGLPPLPDKEVTPGKLSLVIHTVAAVNTTQVLTGLVIDEWTEIVPNARETTGVAFQFDVPDACAPQSVLIAVPPVPGQDWTTESLRLVLMETLDLAKLRAVDTNSLGAAAQHLPGLYLAFNAADHAVSTDFTPLTA